MKYTLVTLFLLTGEEYVEERGLSIQECAGRAALLRIETEEVAEHVEDFIYKCVPEDK
jgi:hypothetical protein